MVKLEENFRLGKQSMVEKLKQILLFFIPDQCHDTYLLEHHFTDVPCFKALVSKLLGFAIIAGSLLVKVPQIMKIIKSKSAEGVSFIAVLLDLIAITSHMAYSYVNGYPFSSWGDTSFLAFQTLVIAELILYYQCYPILSYVFSMAYGGFAYTLCSGKTPLHVLTTMQSLNIPILLAGKLSQAYTIYQNRCVGQLSAVTVFLLLGGSLARIFTSIQETGDSIMIITFCSSTFANALIAFQVVCFWNQKRARDSEQTYTSAHSAAAVKGGTKCD
uniref:Mannose-P-dolichol utilization defect 1 protein homolog n=1 Tax=Glossina austeni TaxID=7395 RepID=A0A1A9VMH9_GLOAU